MAASTRIDLRPLHVVGAIVSLLLFLVIGGCGGGTMGTQTGEQRVAVVGTARGASGQTLSNVQVDVLDDEGVSIGQARTKSDGTYAVEVIVGENSDIVITFTTPSGDTASAAVSVANVATVTANFTVGGSTPPSVVITTTAPTPGPTATQGGGGGMPTSTPVPPPGATNTPIPTSVASPTTTPIATPTTGVCTSGCDAEGTPTPTPASDAVDCGSDAELMSDGISCCAKVNAGKSCCAPGYAAAGLCTCSEGSC